MVYSATQFHLTHANSLIVADAKAISSYDIDRLPFGVRCVDKFLFGGFPRGTGYNLIAGTRGKGKSTVVNQIISQAVEKGKGVLMYSGEKSCGTAKGDLESALVGLFGTERVHVSEKTIYGYTFDAHYEYRINPKYRQLICDSYKELVSFYEPLKSGLDELLSTISDFADCGGEVIIIDNVITLKSDIFNSNLKATEDRDKLETGLGALAQLAIRKNIWIFVVAHTRKSQPGFQPEDLNDLVRGESAIVDFASLVLFYQTPFGEPDSDDRIIKISKNRDLGDITTETGFRVAFEPSCKRIYNPNNAKEELGFKFKWQRMVEEDPVRFGFDVVDVIQNMNRTDYTLNEVKMSKDAELAVLMEEAVKRREILRKEAAVKGATFNKRAEKLGVK